MINKSILATFGSLLDMFSGAGWYAELIAHVAGETDRMVMRFRNPE